MKTEADREATGAHAHRVSPARGDEAADTSYVGHDQAAMTMDPHAEPHMDHGHGDHAAMFRRKFWISLILTVPAVFYSTMIQRWLHYTAPTFTGHTFVAPIFGTLTFAWGGPVFLRGGWDELRGRKPGMMLLISMGLLVAFGSSVATLVHLIDVELWFELATLVTIMLLGHWLEMRAIGQAHGALSALAELLPDEAERVDGDDVTTVHIDALRVGDIVLVRPGGRIPADGDITEGAADIDEAMITGESRPVPRTIGDRVVAGSVASDSSVRVRVTAIGSDTALAGIQRLVKEAQDSQSRAQALADRFAGLLFYVALTSAAVTFAVWTILGDTNAAVERTVTVLVIACPHALGLAIPLTIAVSTSISASAGILVKNRLALERMRTIDTVMFDKTGTLTTGHHTVTDIRADGIDRAELLTLARAVEADSEHPLARAIIELADHEHAPAANATGFRNLAGRGVEATVDGAHIAVGGPSLLTERQLTEPEELAAVTTTWRARGAAVLHVVRDNTVVGAIALEDSIRPESRTAIEELRRLGIRTVMITGDAQQVADSVGGQVGVDEVFAQVLPEDKDQAVAALQARGLKVAMVGDGVNDAPALARADVGIAIGAGTDVAIEAAGVVLASSDPRNVLGVIRLSRASYRKMIQNLAWGAGYNLIAIPLAAGTLTFAGITLSPAVGAILMSASTIVVAANAQLLRNLDLKQPAIPDTTPAV